MIPYEDLCAALERSALNRRGAAPPERLQARPASYDPPTSQTELPPTLAEAPYGEEEQTHVGGRVTRSDDPSGEPSGEIDLGDVLSDEENN